MTETRTLTFAGARADQLTGRLDLPDGKPRAVVLVAHCLSGGNLPVHVKAAEVLGHPVAGASDVLDRGELDRLLTGDGPGGSLADEDLNRSQDGADRERDPETEPVVTVAVPLEYPGRVNRRDQYFDKGSMATSDTGGPSPSPWA